ncbi:S9 family peptidase, partial [bacterium]
MNPEIHSDAPISYPPTRTVDQVDTYHGVEVADPYRWLEDTYSEETAAWVEAQNTVTHAFLESLPQRPALEKRLTELWNYPRYGQPFKRGERYFFSKNDGLQNQSVWYKQASLEAEPEVLFDPNTLSADGTVAISGFNLSEDGSLLAYSLSGSGSDWQEFRVRDVATATDREDLVKWVKFSGASWTADNKGFFYSRFPEPDETQEFQEANLHHKIYYHLLGTDQAKDKLIYEHPADPEWRMNADVSEEGDLLIISLVKAGSKNRLFYVELGDPQNPKVDGPVVKLIDEFEASYGFIGRDGNTFYIETDYQAPLGKLVAIDIENPEKSNWKEIIAESEDTLRSVSLIGDQFIVNYSHNVCSEIRFFDLEGKFVKQLELPGLGSAGGLGGRRDETELFYTFTSFVYPPTIFRYDVTTGESIVFRESEVNFSTEGYESKQVWFKSKD